MAMCASISLSFMFCSLSMAYMYAAAERHIKILCQTPRAEGHEKQ